MHETQTPYWPRPSKTVAPALRECSNGNCKLPVDDGALCALCAAEEGP